MNDKVKKPMPFMVDTVTGTTAIAAAIRPAKPYAASPTALAADGHGDASLATSGCSPAGSADAPRSALIAGQLLADPREDVLPGRVGGCTGRGVGEVPGAGVTASSVTGRVCSVSQGGEPDAEVGQRGGEVGVYRSG